MPIINEIGSTKAYFKNLHIPLSDEWLQCCITWLKEVKPHYTEKELRSSVYEQWLSLDLREVNVPQLPPEVKKIAKSITNKPFILQMMSITDISKSKLQQINQIRNHHALTRGFDEEENPQKNVINKKGVLQMVLTDGVQEINAFEYQPVDCLNLNLSPGIKIFIVHPVTIRKGTFMLENHHVQILGGEVEDILITNAAENILANALGLPINPKPTFIDSKTSINQLITIWEPTPNQIKTNTVSNNDNKNVLNVPIKNNVKKSIDDSISADIDDLLELEREMLQESESKTNKNNQKKLEDNLNTQLNLSDLTDEFFNPWDENESLQDENRIYTLTELKQRIASNRYGNFKTFAKFKAVIKKLTVKDSEGWILQISIEAENEELIVNVHNSVVTELTGKSAEEMMELKKRVQMRDKEASDEVMKALENLRVKLQNLNSMMEIAYKGDEEDKVPFITSIF